MQPINDSSDRNALYYIKGDWLIGIVFSCVLILFALLLKIWMFWKVTIGFIIILIIFWLFIYLKIKAIKLFEDYILEINLFRKEKIYNYNQILYINVNDVNFKDTGKRFALYFDNNTTVAFIVRDKNKFNSIVSFFNEKGLKITFSRYA